MKKIVLSAIMALGFSASAKTYNLRNEEAMRLMEASIGMVSEYTTVDANTKKAVFQGPIQCTYSKNADGFLTNSKCYSGFPLPGGAMGAEVANPLSLIQSIRNYAKDVIVGGLPAIQVDTFTCTLKLNPRKYACAITVN